MKQVLIAVVLFVLSSGLTGCGESNATVHGKVTLNEKPVTSGTVVFTTEDGKKTEHVPIKSDGTYTASTIPMGNLKVAVLPGPKPLAMSMPKGVPMPNVPADSPNAKMYNQSADQYVEIPKPFTDPKTSGLSVKVDKSDVPYDVALKETK